MSKDTYKKTYENELKEIESYLFGQYKKTGTIFKISDIMATPHYKTSSFFKWLRIIANDPKDVEEDALIKEILSIESRRKRFRAFLKIFNEPLSLLGFKINTEYPYNYSKIDGTPLFAEEFPSINNPFSIFSPKYPFTSLLLGISILFISEKYYIEIREKKEPIEEWAKYEEKELESTLKEEGTLEASFSNLHHLPKFCLYNDKEVLREASLFWNWKGFRIENLEEYVVFRSMATSIIEYAKELSKKEFVEFSNLCNSLKIEYLPVDLRIIARLITAFSVLLSTQSLTYDKDILTLTFRDLSFLKNPGRLLETLCRYLIELPPENPFKNLLIWKKAVQIIEEYEKRTKKKIWKKETLKENIYLLILKNETGKTRLLKRNNLTQMTKNNIPKKQIKKFVL